MSPSFTQNKLEWILIQTFCSELKHLKTLQWTKKNIFSLPNSQAPRSRAPRARCARSGKNGKGQITPKTWQSLGRLSVKIESQKFITIYIYYLIINNLTLTTIKNFDWGFLWFFMHVESKQVIEHWLHIWVCFEHVCAGKSIFSKSEKTCLTRKLGLLEPF